MKNTGEMCIVFASYRMVDLGNYFIDEVGKKCVITTLSEARKYAHLVKVPVYVWKEGEE